MINPLSLLILLYLRGSKYSKAAQLTLITSKKLPERNNMNKVCSIVGLLAILMTMMGCQKYYSVESNQALILFPPVNTPATGSLYDGSGDCQTITVNGNYLQDTALKTTNYITVSINITTTGYYKLNTDTVNGCWFSCDSTSAYNTGIHTVKLQGHGTPIVANTSYFNVHYLNSFCSFPVVTNSLSLSEKDYFPMSKGTYWTDKKDSVLNGTSTDTVRYTVTDIKRVENGQTYFRFSASDNDNRYFRKDYKGHYYEYTTILSSFGSFGVSGIDFMFLDDTKKVGESWKTPVYTGTTQGKPLQVSFTTTVLEKNITFQLSPTQSVDSVIHIQEVVTYILNGNNLSQFIYPSDAYYAKKIGVVTFYSDAAKRYLTAKKWEIK